MADTIQVPAGKGAYTLGIGALSFAAGLFLYAVVAGYTYGGLEAKVNTNATRIEKTIENLEDAKAQSLAQNSDVISRLVTIEVLLQEFKQSFDRERQRSRAMEQRTFEAERQNKK